MNGRITDSSVYSSHNAWIKCHIVSYKKSRESKAIPVASKEIKKISIAINAGKFIIIPILKSKSYFSIFNDIDNPITLEERFITLYSIHNVRDGSFVDVSNSATCDPVDKTKIICPLSMIRSVNPYFQLESRKFDSEDSRITPYRFDLILQMKTWKAVIFSPIDLWIAQDWRLKVSDKVLNKIRGWRIPTRSSMTKEIICVTMFQTSRLKALTRLSNRNAISEKEFYGSSYMNDSPLLDITSQIQRESIEFSSPNVGISYDDKSSTLLVDPQSGFNDIDVRLLTINKKRLLALERLKISLDQVTISTIKLFCVSSIDIFQDKSDRLSNYRQLFVNYTLQNDTKKFCHLFIIVVFSDLTEVRLDEIASNYYRVYVSQIDYATNKYLEIPIDSIKFIQHAHVMNISLYESDICQYPKLIFGGLFKVNYQTEKPLAEISTPIPQLTTRTLPIFNQHSTNSNQVQNKELLMDLSSLYYGLYALIALVSLAVLIVLINCLVKFNYRKISSQSNNTINQSVNNKLLNPAPIVDSSSPTFSKHPPLLPPPGPLRNSSNSEAELASSTFWSNCSSQDSTSFTNKKYSSTILGQTIPLSPLNNFSIRTSPLAASVYANTKYRHNPSPSSDQGDGGYLSGENQSKFGQTSLVKKSPDDRIVNSDSIEITNDNCVLSHYPDTYPVPPCPPLKWSIQWATSMVSALPVFSQSYTSNLINDSTCVVSRAVPCAGSMNQWITNKTIKSSSSVPYTKSIDNLCEKSSGLGSLTSTQQEDYSMLSDDDNYHVSINSDKEHYRKYLKKC